MTPDFRTELARLVDLYYALGGDWSPHGYTDTWNDALANARTALATPPPTDDDLIEIARELRKTAEYLQLGCGWNKALRAIESAANLIEGDLLQRLVPPPEPPKNCWLDDEPDLFPSPCVFDDPDEVINNCTYARTVKCKTDCKYYRVAAHPEPVQAPPPEPPTVMEIIELSTEIEEAGLGQIDFARAALERWGR